MRRRDATYPPWLWITVESCPETGLAARFPRVEEKAEMTKEAERGRFEGRGDAHEMLGEESDGVDGRTSRGESDSTGG